MRDAESPRAHLDEKTRCPRCGAAVLVTDGCGMVCSHLGCSWMVLFGPAGEWRHDLKIERVFFDDVDDGRKRFEVRRNDRGFAVGHLLRLREWWDDRQEYTGREVTVRVGYVLHQTPDRCLLPGVVVMGIERLEATADA